MTISVAPTPSSKPVPKSRVNLVMTICLAIAAPLFLFFIVWATSGVSGEEFSPTHFQSRRFELRELPWLRFQIGGISRTTTTDSTSQYLIANKLINVPTGAPKRWDLMKISRAFQPNVPADASILTGYLRARRGSGTNWEQWSKSYPAAAAILWPFVQKLATDNLYLMLPRVFELAENERDPTKLQAALNRYLIEELPSFADDLAASGHTDRAILALSNAVNQYPNEPTLQAKLAEYRVVEKE